MTKIEQVRVRASEWESEGTVKTERVSYQARQLSLNVKVLRSVREDLMYCM